MSKYPTLKNAPIVEALTDIQVVFPSGIAPEAMNKIYADVSDRLPNQEQQGFIEFGVKTTAQGIPQSFNATSGFAGLRYSSTDKTRILQVGSRGFTFSRLAPYSNGDEFRGEAKAFWQSFADATKPARIRRIALRCINRILVPIPFQDFSEYFNTFVVLPPEVPQGMADFLIRVVLPNPDLPDTAAVITIKGEPLSAAPNHVPVLFDIDVFQNVDLEPQSEKIWETMELLRQYRNKIFFESLTKKTLRMYQ